MRISMMIISRGSLGLPLAIVTVMAISTIRVSVSMAITMRVTMMIISRLSIGFSNSFWLSISLAVVAMMTVTSISITTIAMMVISWLSDSCAEDGKRYSNQKIHVPVGLNFSETPHV